MRRKTVSLQKKRGQDEDVEKLKILQTIEPEGVNAVSQGGDYELVELAVDSGATETVIGEQMLQTVEVKQGSASRRGVEYEVSNGVRIPNLGEKKFAGISAERGSEEYLGTSLRR